MRRRELRTRGSFYAGRGFALGLMSLRLFLIRHVAPPIRGDLVGDSRVLSDHLIKSQVALKQR